MVAVVRELDFDLCRMTLYKVEEAWNSGRSPGRTDFEFDGFGLANIAYNINRIALAGLVVVRGGDEKSKESLGSWPSGLTEKGWKFVAAIKDEERWRRSVEAVNAQNGPESLKPLVAEVFRGLT